MYSRDGFRAIKPHCFLLLVMQIQTGASSDAARLDGVVDSRGKEAIEAQAQRGDTSAKLLLGALFLGSKHARAFGLAPNLAEAERWLLDALQDEDLMSAREYANACSMLAHHVYLGIPIAAGSRPVQSSPKPDVTKAIKYLKLAAVREDDARAPR